MVTAARRGSAGDLPAQRSCAPAPAAPHPRGRAALDGEIIPLFPSRCTVRGKLIPVLLHGPVSAINKYRNWFWTEKVEFIGAIQSYPETVSIMFFHTD